MRRDKGNEQNPQRDNQQQRLSKKQALTAAGLLGVIAASEGYGIGSSSAVAFYSVAGLAVACGMTAIQSVPSILSGDYLEDIITGLATFTMAIGALTGFFQSRGGFNIVSQGAEAVAGR